MAPCTGRVSTWCTTSHTGHHWWHPAGNIYISTILLRSIANDFCKRFHEVDSKVAHAASKIIQVVLYASRHNFWDVEWMVEWCSCAIWSECNLQCAECWFTAHQSQILVKIYLSALQNLPTSTLLKDLDSVILKSPIAAVSVKSTILEIWLQKTSCNSIFHLFKILPKIPTSWVKFDEKYDGAIGELLRAAVF